MRYWHFGILALILVGICVMVAFLPSHLYWIIYTVVSLAILLLLLLFRSVLKPAQTVSRGLDLLAA